MLFRFQEKILIREIKNGNQSAFASLYNEYIDSVYRFILLRVGSIEVAKDLASDCFLKIFDFLGSGAKIENFRALLFKIARHKIIDFYRQQSKSTVSLEDAHPANFASDENQPLALEVKRVREIISSLKEEYQEPVLLYYFEGFSWKEVADILDLPPATLRQRAHRGIKMLKEKLEQ